MFFVVKGKLHFGLNFIDLRVWTLCKQSSKLRMTSLEVPSKKFLSYSVFLLEAYLIFITFIATFSRLLLIGAIFFASERTWSSTYKSSASSGCYWFR